MGNRLCIGLFLIFRLYPRPGLDIADDGLAALMDVNVLNGGVIVWSVFAVYIV